MRKNTFIIIVLVLIIFTGSLFFREKASAPNPFMNEKEVEKVIFATKDGVEIAGNFYPQQGNVLRGSVLFLHMMPATKERWDSLAKELQKKDVASLAIDLRGHGESTKLKVKSEKLKVADLDYLNFTDGEHQKSILDVEAALEWLDKKNGGLPISIVGASIGANLALQALAKHKEIKKAALLSPGLNYRSIEAIPFITSLLPDQSVFYATSKDDGDNATQTQALYDAAKTEKTIKVYENAGHGTDMFKETDLSALLIDFLTK